MDAQPTTLGLRLDAKDKSSDHIRLPSAFFDYGWPLYLPPTATSLYKAVCRIADTDLRGATAKYQLLDRSFTPWEPRDMEEEITLTLFIERCRQMEWTFPGNVAQCLDLILSMGLVQVHKDSEGLEVYDIILPVPHPADVLGRSELRRPQYLRVPPDAAL